MMMEDYSPLETLFEGVDLPVIKPHRGSSLQAFESPTLVHSTPSSSTASPEQVALSPTSKLSVEKWDPFEFEVRTKIDKLGSTSNAENYSSGDDAFILYRQNQFELEATIVPTFPSQLYISFNESTYLPLVQFDYWRIYAVKQTRKDSIGIPIITTEERTELFQHLSARDKKVTQIPSSVPVVNGQGIFSRLQFKNATGYNQRGKYTEQPHPNQQDPFNVGSERIFLSGMRYFRLVLSIIAKVDGTPQYVASKVSPRLIVRGRNPGNFDKHELKASTESQADDSSKSAKRNRPSPELPQQLSPLSHSPQSDSPQSQTSSPQPPPPPKNKTPKQKRHQPVAQPQISIQTPAQNPNLPQHMHMNQNHVPLQMAQQPPMHLNSHVQLQLQELYKQQELQQILHQVSSSDSDLSSHVPPPMHPQYFPQQGQINTNMPMPNMPQSYLPPPNSGQDQYQLNYDESSRKSQKRHIQDVKANKRPQEVQDDMIQRDGKGNVFLHGKVGINTPPTDEALTVHGNILVSGHYLKPSDERVKTNTRAQLENIQNINLYEYDLRHEYDKDGKHLHETGVLAQELRKTMPSAVQVLNNVTLADGTVMEELLVVQDRALLYETVGATKELGAGLKESKAHLVDVHKHSQELKDVTTKAFSALGRSIDFVLSESGDDTRDDISNSACYCTLFGLGPAWTAYFLGFLLPPLWLCGVFYISSIQHVKKLAGFFSAGTLVLYIIYMSLIYSTKRSAVVKLAAPLVVAILGIVFICGPIAMTWGQRRVQRKYQKVNKKRAHKARLRKELVKAHVALEEV